MALLFVLLSTVATALMAKQTGAGKGLGRGKGVAPRKGITFDRNGEHAREILRGWLAGETAYQTWDDFLLAHKAWLLSPDGKSGFYLQNNLNCNYNAVIKRYSKHVDPNDPYDGACLLAVHIVWYSIFLGFSLFVRLSTYRQLSGWYARRLWRA